ncbi:MAG: hypothetical protein IPF53_13120 [Blastocatellia bacterium]|nr:hypothetical protein [Blastocatellia bacterium]
MAADWTRIRAVFEEALSIEPAARPAFLDQVCGTDDGLRREVDSLLDEHDRPGSFVGDSPIARLAGLEVIWNRAGPEPDSRARDSSSSGAGVVVGERYRIGPRSAEAAWARSIGREMPGSEEMSQSR